MRLVHRRFAAMQLPHPPDLIKKAAAQRPRLGESFFMASTDPHAPARKERPISPHLQVYKLSISMLMSIVHRMTGAGLYIGTLLMAWWLIAAATGPDAYESVRGFMGSPIGLLILFGYTWALLHHMLGGIRHLIWDTIHGLEPTEREMLTLATLIGSIALTLILWVFGYLVMGGPR